MLDLGATERVISVDDPAEGLVGALSARAAENGAPAHAAAEIRRRRAAGETPIGLYRLSEVLAPPDVPGAPSLRHAADEPGAVVEVVRRYPCALLDAGHPSGVARNLAAVLADGKRVLVSGSDPARLAAVRAALPTPVRGLCLDGPVPLSDAELRELRTLLATSTPARRARLGQTMPDPELIPTVDEVAQLCRGAGSRGFPAADEVEQIPELLSGLPPARLSGLMDAARRCRSALDAMDRRDDDPRWSRALLDRVLFNGVRTDLDALLRRATDMVRAGDELRDAGDHMALVGTIDRRAVEQLRAYADYLDGGGRSRHYFRSPQQRAVEPVLRQLRLDGAPLRDSKLIRQALAFIGLVKDMQELGDQCAQLGVPAPADIPGVASLGRQLARIQDAARAVENLRREVLFVNPHSPVTVQAVPMADRVAKVIVESGGPAQMGKARRRLSDLADRLAGSVPAATAVPELAELVGAMRATNVQAYLGALEPLAAARREQADQRRLVELLSRLREGAPELAETWAESGPRGTQGTARFVQLDELLDRLPEPDNADLVLLLDAGSLGAENLLVAAAAPRLLAVARGAAGAGDPAASPDTVLTTLRRAGVPVVVTAYESTEGGIEGGAPPAEEPAPSNTESATAELAVTAPPAPGRAAPAPVNVTRMPEVTSVPVRPSVPAQREAPVEESRAARHAAPGPARHAMSEMAERARSDSKATAEGDQDEPAEPRFVVMPLGIVAVDPDGDQRPA